MMLQLKRATGFSDSQRMASTLTSIGCIIYLAYGTNLMRAVFCWWRQKRNLDVFFLPENPKMFAGGR
jgi:hypothetical protein